MWTCRIQTMYHVWFRVLIWLPLFAAAKTDEELEQAKTYLHDYGYLPTSLLHSREQEGNMESISEALRTFQKVTDIPVTGRLDNATLETMNMPRCGLKDSFNVKILRFTVTGIWHKTTLTYRIYNFARGLGEARTRKAIQAAFKYWSDVSPLQFYEVTGKDPADIELAFHGKHSTCPTPFDGPGKILAHAFVPEHGVVHFDSDERWANGKRHGKKLKIVAAHEIGHALGLGHSQYSRALMAPLYHGDYDKFQLHSDDINGIQALYGKPAKKSETDSPVPDPCTAHLDAIMLGPLHRTFAFSGDYVWLIPRTHSNLPIRIDHLWKELPGHLDAAVHSRKTNMSYFLKGNKLWVYSNHQLEPGFPKIFAIPPNIDAAFYFHKNKTLIFVKGSVYWEWDEQVSGEELKFYPKPISNIAPGFPANPDAAFTWTNEHIYIFKADLYWRLSPRGLIHKGSLALSKTDGMRCNG